MEVGGKRGNRKRKKNGGSNERGIKEEERNGEKEIIDVREKRGKVKREIEREIEMQRGRKESEIREGK